VILCVHGAYVCKPHSLIVEGAVACARLAHLLEPHTATDHNTLHIRTRGEGGVPWPVLPCAHHVRTEPSRAAVLTSRRPAPAHRAPWSPGGSRMRASLLSPSVQPEDTVESQG
jgi:hypothetical protein